MPTEVKICGLRDAEAVDAALEAGADYVGFVFFERSPRNISVAEAAPLAARAREGARVVALTVNADDALLREILKTLRPDLMQLHGNETPDRVAAVRTLTGRPVMKAVPLATRSDLALAEHYRIADRLLLDAKPLPGATRPGGNAAAFDWTILDGFASPRPWLLAGGLTPTNIARALKTSRAPGVDVSSGVEKAPGVKDPHLIRAFVKAVRAFDRLARLLVG